MEKDFRSTKRRWIKLYPVESLQGSIRYQLTSAERGVWYDLLCFSSLCSNTGDISDRDGNPFPLSYIANRLNVQLSLLKSTIDKCVAEGRLTQDDNGLHITNWERYQSEYDRQKPYRQEYPEYTYKMFCEDYDALKEELGTQGEGARTILYFTEKYGWEGVSSKGSRYHRFFLSTLKAVVNNDEKNPDNPDDEEVAKEILTSLQG